MRKAIIPLAIIVFALLSMGLLLSQENAEDEKFKKVLDINISFDGIKNREIVADLGGLLAAQKRNIYIDINSHKDTSYYTAHKILEPHFINSKIKPIYFKNESI